MECMRKNEKENVQVQFANAWDRSSRSSTCYAIAVTFRPVLNITLYAMPCHYQTSLSSESVGRL